MSMKIYCGPNPCDTNSSSHLSYANVHSNEIASPPASCASNSYVQYINADLASGTVSYVNTDGYLKENLLPKPCPPRIKQQEPRYANVRFAPLPPVSSSASKKEQFTNEEQKVAEFNSSQESMYANSSVSGGSNIGLIDGTPPPPVVKRKKPEENGHSRPFKESLVSTLRRSKSIVYKTRGGKMLFALGLTVGCFVILAPVTAFFCYRFIPQLHRSNPKHECEKVPENARHLPNIDHALIGYNVSKLSSEIRRPSARSPDAESNTSQFARTMHHIFSATYRSQDWSGDCRFRIPHGVIFLKRDMCQLDFKSRVFESKEAFDMFFNAGGAGKIGLKFILQAELHLAMRVEMEKVEQKQSVLTIAYAECTSYDVHIDVDNLPPLNDAFRRDVLTIAQQWSTATPNNSINFTESVRKLYASYGTHVPAKMVFGSVYLSTFSMSRAIFDAKFSNKAKLEASAKMLGKKIADIKGDYSSNHDLQAFEQNVAYKSYIIGSKPPASGDVTEWAANVVEDPLPIESEFKPIETVIRDVIEKDSTIKGQQFMQMLEQQRSLLMRNN